MAKIEKNRLRELKLHLFTSNPRSSAVRSSTIAHNTFHRQSISAKYPRHIGDAALNANLKMKKKMMDPSIIDQHTIIGVNGVS
jgi:hypothetical protein